MTPPGYWTADEQALPGNATRVYGVRLRDRQDRPVAGIEVRPLQAGFDGTPSTAGGFEFMPRVAVTGEDGCAYFTALVPVSAPPDSLWRFRFELPGFGSGDAASTPLGCDWTLAVSSAGYAFVKSGQGQIGTAGTVLANPLVLSVPHATPDSPETVYVSPAPGALVSTDGVHFTGGPLEITVTQSELSLYLNPGTAPLPQVLTAAARTADPAQFGVGPPEVQLVRKPFVRDEEGRVVRDEEGNPILLEGMPLEPIALGAPDRFVRESLALSFGEPAEPDPASEFLVEARLPDVGPVFTARVESLDGARAGLDSVGAYAFVAADVPLNRQESVGGRYYFYRSDPMLVTTVQANPDAGETVPSPIASLPDGRRLLQGTPGGYISVMLHFVTAEDIQGVAAQTKSPWWITLGDSLTNGTMGVTVVGDHQEHAWPVTLASTIGIPFHVGSLAEPGVPARIYLPDRRYLTEPETLGKAFETDWSNATLFMEAAGDLTLPPGRLEPLVKPCFINNFGVDGLELRGLGRLGSSLETLGKDYSFYPPGFCPPPGTFVYKLTNPYRNEELAGMEGTTYNTIHNPEFWVVNELFVHGALNPTESRMNRSPLALARASKADLAVFWTCNNDGLQAVLGGLTIQARLTPAEDFNAGLHRQELFAYQYIRHLYQDEEFPNLYDDTTRARALAQLDRIAFKPALEEAVRQFEEKNPSADLVLCEIPGVEMLPILFDLGGTIKESLEAQRNAVAGRLSALPNGNELLNQLPVAGFSHKIDCFGHDVTSLMENVRLFRNVLEPDPKAAGSGYEKDSGEYYPDGTKVCIKAVFDRIKRRMANHLDIVYGISGDYTVIWGCPRIIPRTVTGRRNFIREILGNGDDNHPNWKLFVYDVFQREFMFRRDEALEPEDLRIIKTRIDDYNRFIATLVNARPSSRILFPSNQLFASIVANGYYTIGDAPEVTVFPTLNGGLFSFDGVHPGFVGHAILAEEMRRTFMTVAATRASLTVGGVPIWNFLRRIGDRVNHLYLSDPVIQYSRHDQIFPQ